MQGASFGRVAGGPLDDSNRAAGTGAILAGGICLLVGLPTPLVPLYGFALAAAPVAAVLGWWSGPRVVSGTRREVVVWALLVGGFAAVGGLLIYSVTAVLVSMLPGSGATQPETPYGYVILPVLLVAVLGPVLAIPGSVLAAIWAVVLRRTNSGHPHVTTDAGFLRARQEARVSRFVPSASAGVGPRPPGDPRGGT